MLGALRQGIRRGASAGGALPRLDRCWRAARGGSSAGASRPLCSAPPAPALHTPPPQYSHPENPVRLSPDMRPPGDSSRKYVRVDANGRAYATGRRKTAVARVWVWPCADGAASLTINGKSLGEFLGGHWAQRYDVLKPFFVTRTEGLFSVRAHVGGGGYSGQAGALRHGIATAMQGLDFTLRPALRAAGLLTRDPRRRERKKPGQRGARAKFAWVKR